MRFSVLGDIGSTAASDAVLRSIAVRDDDFTLAVGDLSYGDDGEEKTWCRFVTTRVGATHPFELVSGNHESDGANGDIDRFVRCLPNRLPGLVGTYGRQWYVDQPATNPLVRVVMISPALDFGHGSWSYDDGTTHQAWLGLRGRTAGIPWVVVGMHKPCLSVGNYECDPGATSSPAARRRRRPRQTGHEHLCHVRARPRCRVPRCVPAGSPPECVRDTAADVRDGGHRWHRAARRARLGPLVRRSLPGSGKDRDPSYGVATTCGDGPTGDGAASSGDRWPVHRPAVLTR